MKFALAAVGFVSGDTEHNSSVIKKYLKDYSGKADIMIFGEAFLQGFYALSSRFDEDKAVALPLDSPVIEDIACSARENRMAVSFGFIECEGETLYSSQLTFDACGKLTDHYRRISIGWKEYFADSHYAEGEVFHCFDFCGKRIAVALCGDLWYDENIQAMENLKPDIVFWPVYTDFNCSVWNKSEKYEYAFQVKSLGAHVLYVNSCCMDRDYFEIARGGAAHFSGGSIAAEIPSGKEDVLIIEV